MRGGAGDQESPAINSPPSDRQQPVRKVPREAFAGLAALTVYGRGRVTAASSRREFLLFSVCIFQFP